MHREEYCAFPLAGSIADLEKTDSCGLLAVNSSMGALAVGRRGNRITPTKDGGRGASSEIETNPYRFGKSIIQG